MLTAINIREAVICLFVGFIFFNSSLCNIMQDNSYPSLHANLFPPCPIKEYG